MIPAQAAVFNQIAATVPRLPGWCSVERACEFASHIFACKPAWSVNIGVFGGRDLLAMALAHKAVGSGRVLAIDPWSAEASIEGEVEANKKWWSQVDYARLYRDVLALVEEYDLGNHVVIQRKKSDEVLIVPGTELGLISFDGNHTEQAVRDVMHFAPHVPIGGKVYCDDLNWTQGYVQKSLTVLEGYGFKRLHDRDTGAWFERIAMTDTP